MDTASGRTLRVTVTLASGFKIWPTDMAFTNGRMGIATKVNGETLSGTDRDLTFLLMVMSSLVSTIMAKLRDTGSIDGRTEILTVERLSKDEKKERVFGKSQMKNKATNMKETTSMITSMASVNSFGLQVAIFLVNISMT
jgi:hypothetical protein